MTRFRTHLCITALAAGLLTLGSVQASAQDTGATVLANTCFSCHGTEGKSHGAMPAIAGRPADYIELALKQFRSDEREGTVMNRIAKGFTAEEIESLSRYFAVQQ